MRIILSVVLSLWATASAAQRPSLREIRADAEGLLLLLDAPVPHSIFRLEQPPRLVIDLHGALLRARAPGTAALATAGVLRAAQFSPEPEPVTRLVLELAAPARHETLWSGAALRVSIEAEPGLRDALAPLPGPALGPWLRPGAPVPAQPRALPPPPRGSGLAPGPVLTELRVREDAVELSFSRRAAVRPMIFSEPPRLVLDMAAELAGTGETRRLAGAGRWLRGARAAPRAAADGRAGTRAVLELAEPAPFALIWEDARLLIRLGTSEGEADASLELEGLLADGAGRPLDGNFLLRFTAPRSGAEPWSEELYVRARAGRFRVRLGERRPFPPTASAESLRVEAPEGTGWSAISLTPLLKP